MKYLKTYESVRDQLKPKSIDDILRSMKGQNIYNIYIKLLNNKINVPDDLKNRLKKYIRIFSDDYLNLWKKNNISFTDEEKMEIDGVIHDSKNPKKNYYKYDDIIDNRYSYFNSLYIVEGNKLFKIHKYDDYILIEHGKFGERAREFYICPTIKELIYYLDEHLIFAHKIE